MSIAEKLTAIAENVPKVYDAGKQAENIAWWDLITGKNTKVAYDNVFRSSDWTGREFKPPYQIKPTSSTYILATTTNLTKVSSEYLDTSNVQNFAYAFSWSSIQELGIIDTRGATTVNRPFHYATNLVTIEKLILKADGSQANTTPFNNCTNLQNIIIEGKIGSDWSFQWCSKLTVDSLMSILDALYDYSGTSTTRTLTLHADSKAKLSESDIAKARGKGWTIA